MTSTALYARVSTSDQNCEQQLTALREYAEIRKWEVAGEYVDAGVSGKNTNRPEFQRLLADARAGNVESIAVWKIDRFSRSVLDLVTTIRELDSIGVRFISITQGIDTDQSNPASRLLVNLMGAFAEFERETIVERIRAGVDRTMADVRAGRKLTTRSGKNLPPGRPRKVFDRAQVPLLRQQGLSCEAIGRRLGVSASLVQKISTK